MVNYLSRYGYDYYSPVGQDSQDIIATDPRLYPQMAPALAPDRNAGMIEQYMPQGLVDWGHGVHNALESARGKPTVFGKTLGLLGLDESGKRAATSWKDAALSTLHLGPDLIDGVVDSAKNVARNDGQSFLTSPDPADRARAAQYSGDVFNVAGALPLGGALAGRMGPAAIAPKEAMPAPRPIRDFSELALENYRIDPAARLAQAEELYGMPYDNLSPVRQSEVDRKLANAQFMDNPSSPSLLRGMLQDRFDALPGDASTKALHNNTLAALEGRQRRQFDIINGLHRELNHEQGLTARYGAEADPILPPPMGREARAYMPSPGQDPVPGVTRMDGSPLYSNSKEASLPGLISQGKDKPTIRTAISIDGVPFDLPGQASHAEVLGHVWDQQGFKNASEGHKWMRGHRLDHGYTVDGKFVPKAEAAEYLGMAPYELDSNSASVGRLAEIPLYSNPEEAAPLSLISQKDTPQGITAYHGSPHDFDRFSMDKIGTGEGAQAYGHGLYFAENEGVAKAYRDQLSANVDVDVARANYERVLRDIDEQQRLDPSPHRVKLRQDVEKAIKDLDSIEMKPPGHLYEVRINADPEHFLDWDKPLSQQSEKVKSVVAPIHRAQYANEPGFTLENSTARDILSEYRTGGAEAAAALRDAGIPGIRYLDEGSRTAGEGSRNFVVFDDKLISIVRKYGWAGAAAMLGMSADDLMSQAQAQQDPVPASDPSLFR